MSFRFILNPVRGRAPTVSDPDTWLEK